MSVPNATHSTGSRTSWGQSARAFGSSWGSWGSGIAYRVAAPVLRPVGNVAYSAGSIVLKPVQKAAGWAGRRAIAPVQDLAKRAGGAMAAPVVANIDALRATTSEKLTSLASNTAERINKLASDTVPCAKAYGKLAQTLNETIETGAYLATAVTGLYIYNMANNGLGGKNLCGQIQRGVGLTIAAVAGAYWLGRVAVNAIGPKLLKLSQFDFGASIMLPKK